MQAKQIKEKAALDKSIINQDYYKNTLEVNKRIKDWKRRAKSISNYKDFARLQDIKSRYDSDLKNVVKEQSVFEDRIKKASVDEDHMIHKLQNTMQV